jgi:hypothetical protein
MRGIREGYADTRAVTRHLESGMYPVSVSGKELGWLKKTAVGIGPETF